MSVLLEFGAEIDAVDKVRLDVLYIYVIKYILLINNIRDYSISHTLL